MLVVATRSSFLGTKAVIEADVRDTEFDAQTGCRVELSNVRDLMRCPRKLFLQERLQALQARKVLSYISSDPSSNRSTMIV